MFKIILVEGYFLADYTRICSAIAHLGDEDPTFVFLGMSAPWALSHDNVILK
jgi:hypothetical protein